MCNNLSPEIKIENQNNDEKIDNVQEVDSQNNVQLEQQPQKLIRIARRKRIH